MSILKSTEVVKLMKEVFTLSKQSLSKIFEDLGITGPQGMVIGVLSKYGKMKISDLSSKLGLSNSTISGIIDRLELQKAVERERSEEDKRVVYVSITPEFKKIHQDFLKRTDSYLENIMSSGTPEDLDKIIEGMVILKRLLNNYKNDSAGE